MKNLLFLTDFDNGWAEEDRMIGDYLATHYNVRFAGINDAEQFEDGVDGILIHNTWPGGAVDHQIARRYRETKQSLRERLQSKGIPSFNAHNGRGDMQGKAHLLELQAAGFPVIPTAANLNEIDSLPSADQYRVKPLDSFGGQLQGNYARGQLAGIDLSNCIIQPRLGFKREVQVYYVDGEVFCVAESHDKAHADMQLVKTDPGIVSLADKFRQWNTLSHGLQRVDFIETQGGELLLMEIEDDAPYYNVPLLPPDMQQQLFGMIHQSLKTNLGL